MTSRTIALPLPGTALEGLRRRVRPPAEHMASANARVHVTAMLESKHAFDHLDEIAAVPGIDALTIGPTDLEGELIGEVERGTAARTRRPG